MEGKIRMMLGRLIDFTLDAGVKPMSYMYVCVCVCQ